MRIINAGGFNKTERKQWRAIIFNNLVSAFQTIFAAMQEQETDFEDDDNLVRTIFNLPKEASMLTMTAFRRAHSRGPRNRHRGWHATGVSLRLQQPVGRQGRAAGNIEGQPVCVA